MESSGVIQITDQMADFQEKEASFSLVRSPERATFLCLTEHDP